MSTRQYSTGRVGGPLPGRALDVRPAALIAAAAELEIASKLRAPHDRRRVFAGRLESDATKSGIVRRAFNAR